MHLDFWQQAASALPKLKIQLDMLKPARKPLSDSIFKHGLLQQKDKDVRLLVSICVCEILRILAPEPGFSNAEFRVSGLTLIDLSVLYRHFWCLILLLGHFSTLTGHVWGACWYQKSILLKEGRAIGDYCKIQLLCDNVKCRMWRLSSEDVQYIFRCDKVRALFSHKSGIFYISHGLFMHFAWL